MICFGANIGGVVVGFFIKNQACLLNYKQCNLLIRKISGINNFFANQEQADELSDKIRTADVVASEPDRRAYGDFQTNMSLAKKVAKYALSKYRDVEFLLEPTCGKGNFLLAAIEQSSGLKKVVGIEIYQPYVWETKFKILEHFLLERRERVPEIEIIHANVFEFPFEKLAKSTKNLKTLIIGNPPWVTNSELGSIDSRNLPPKSNFKKDKGFDAITGKGNFDIGEYISLLMFKYFDRHTGLFAFLVKNSVVKSVIKYQRKYNFRIGQSEQLNIDAKKEFGVSVAAGLFLTHLSCDPGYTCLEQDFYTHKPSTTFGWYKNRFVYSIQDYDASAMLDGESAFVWRSGVKHDCAKVMELGRNEGHYTNALGESFELENDLVYGLLKSSDLRASVVTSFRKMIVITQQKIGQDTAYIKERYPHTYRYLWSHKSFFDKRKSGIYKGKPDFSIFGIGDYSFAPYKVAISGLYKSTHFSLVHPVEGKPVMLDDTCYFIGFDHLKMAEIAHYLLNSALVQRFLKSIIFSGSKRPVTKDILMRIDFESAFERLEFNSAQKHIPGLGKAHWDVFRELIKTESTEQVPLF